MTFQIASLWRAPSVNPINKKARSIPALNPTDIYGRVFTLSWFGFMIAFWSWYAFPPLLTITIKGDLNLSQADVSNSNIVGLVATLLVRLVAGAACDRFGPRWTFVGCLLAGAIPTALAGAVFNIQGLLALRFFIGILGGTFIPCQVWTTGFFDKDIVGTANAFTAGLGNAGGGITYFVMPAIFDSLVAHANLSPHVAWRVAYIVPFILIVTTAVVIMVSCPDTPSGSWAERGRVMEMSEAAHGRRASESLDQHESEETPKASPAELAGVETGMLDQARGEVVEKPTVKGTFQVATSPQTMVLGATYFCAFGAELAINSILGAYYLSNFPALGQTGSGNWAAMFGLLNAVFRPAGGIVSDALYRRTRSAWAKKLLIHGLEVVAGGFLIVIGLVDPRWEAAMFGLVGGMAFFLEASNGAIFSLVPHVHPSHNGTTSGITGASGNLGGIIFAVLFRVYGSDYARVFWIVGAVLMGVNACAVFVRPLPRPEPELRGR